MRFTARQLANMRTVTIIAFMVACAIFMGWLWTSSGGTLPFISEPGYRVSATFDDVDNLAQNSDVRSYGVTIGYVAAIDTVDGKVEVTIDLDDGPLHEGVQLQMRPKTLLEETFVDVVDGSGAEIAENVNLTETGEGVIVPSVQADDVINAMDPEVRAAFGDMVSSLDPATEGTSDEVRSLVEGLGDLGRDGTTALDVLAAQGTELRTLVTETTELLEVLDSGNGQISDLVVAAHQLNEVTAEQNAELASTFEGLPGLVVAAGDAAPSIVQLSDSLAPISASLREAAPSLGPALDELAATTPVLRGLLPELDTDLQLAPATLERIPSLATPLRNILPEVDVALADVNPMLAYMEPYGPDIAAFFSNFSSVSSEDDFGKYARFMTLYNVDTLTNRPVLPLDGLSAACGELIPSLPLPAIPGLTSALDLGDALCLGDIYQPQSNPYGGPGSLTDPQPFEGEYPRVLEED